LENVAKGNGFNAKYQTFFHEAGHNIDYVASKTPFTPYSATYGVEPMAGNSTFVKAIHADVDALVKERAAALKAEFNVAKANKDLAWFQKHDIYYYDNIKFTKGYAYADITKELQKIDIIARGDVSDIMEGATKGKIQAGIGHGEAYWKKHTLFGVEKGLATEAFAEMYSCTMSNPASLEQIKKYFPKAYKIFKEMLKEMGKE
jgi:hypothetical protein